MTTSRTRYGPSPPALYRSTPLETASSLIFGVRSDAGPLPEAPAGMTPRQALEQSVLAALRRPPCVVSFSGGRDSSAVLAVAVDAARRHGLPLPVPVTLRFPHVETAAEEQWQEVVVRHLALPNWERIEITDELDLLGPYASAVLRRHGHVWPFNAHFHVPILERAVAGALLTGVGGDELFWTRRWWRVSMVLQRRLRPEPRDALRLGLAIAPPAVRAFELRLRVGFPAEMPWLTPAAARAVARSWFRSQACEPVRFDTAVRKTWWQSRTRQALKATLDVLAADVGAVAVHPLQDPLFLATVVAHGGAVGYRTRTEAMWDLFGDLLPRTVIERSSKAFFDGAFWSRHSRAFGREWDSTGVDPTLVDVDVLRSIWSQHRPVHAQTWPLFQAVWLNADRQRSGTGQAVE